MQSSSVIINVTGWDHILNIVSCRRIWFENFLHKFTCGIASYLWSIAVRIICKICMIHPRVIKYVGSQNSFQFITKLHRCLCWYYFIWNACMEKLQIGFLKAVEGCPKFFARLEFRIFCPCNVLAILPWNAAIFLYIRGLNLKILTC